MNCEACNIECSKFGKHRNGLQRFRCAQCGKTFTEEHARLFAPMTVPEDKALLAVQLLIEGASVRTVERVTGLHRDSILRLLVLAGERCIALMDTAMRNLRCEHIQADEIWSFVAKKQRNVKVDDPDELGDAWVFVAMDEQTKLIPSYIVGRRDRPTTYQFLADLRDRMAKEHRFQITTDGFVFYRKGVEDVFAGQADFAQMIKLYGGSRPTRRSRTLFAFANDRNDSEDTRWPPRPAPHKHQLCRAPEPHDSHGDSTLHAPDQCVLKEARQSQSSLRVALRLLQFLPDTSQFARDSRDGSWYYGSHIHAARIAFGVMGTERRCTIDAPLYVHT